MSGRRLDVDGGTRFVADALAASGVAERDAATAAARLVDADLRGRHGHGLARLAPYHRRIVAGGYDLGARPTVVRRSGAAALVDGGNGLGQVVMTHAVRVAADLAAEHGVGWVSVRRSNHAGAAGTYAGMLVDQGFVGLYLAVANANHMAPWGGVEALLGTNPLAIAVPAGDEAPFQLDMATTVASAGEVKQAAARGEVPEGWAVDAEGRPVTDPAEVAHALLLPAGGHKGYGLNVAIGLLAGVLGGAAFGDDVVDFNADDETPTNTGQAVLALRPDVVGDPTTFRDDVDRHLRRLRASRPAPGQGPVRYPGQHLPDRAAAMRRDGIPVAPHVVDALREVAATTGTTRALDAALLD